jgi:hypothetical protein
MLAGCPPPSDQQGAVFVFQAVLDALAAEPVTERALAFCPKSHQTTIPDSPHWAPATAQALAAFLVQFAEELIGAGVAESALAPYTDSLHRFSALREVRAELGAAVLRPCGSVSPDRLAQTWTAQGLCQLPAEFDWAKLCRRYDYQAHALLRASPDLRTRVQLDLAAYFLRLPTCPEERLLMAIYSQPAVSARDYAASHAAPQEALAWLTSCLASEAGGIREVMVEELATRGRDAPDTLRFLKAFAGYPWRGDPTDHPCETAVAAVACGWKDHAETLPWLRQLARRSPNWCIRKAAVSQLADGWAEDDETLPLLQDRASQDEHHSVRESALAALAFGWPANPDLCPLLKARAEHDPAPTVRAVALAFLASTCRGDPGTPTFLKDRAGLDEASAVKGSALRALASAWPGDPGVLPIIKHAAQQREDSPLREAALAALALGWKGTPETLAALKTVAAETDRGLVADFAVEALACGWQDDSAPLAWLRACAASAEAESFDRETAVEVLARGWQADPATLPWLKARARQGEDWSVRAQALEQLARGWSADPDTLALLKGVFQETDDDYE